MRSFFYTYYEVDANKKASANAEALNNILC